MPKPNVWLPVNHTKPTNIFYWNKRLLANSLTKLTACNYASARRQLQNTVNCAMSITINCMVNKIILVHWWNIKSSIQYLSANIYLNQNLLFFAIFSLDLKYKRSNLQWLVKEFQDFWYQKNFPRKNIRFWIWHLW